MNGADRQFLAKLQDVLHDMADMAPFNPCDTKAKFYRFDKLVDSSRLLYFAISSHGCGDLDEAIDSLSQAREVIRTAKDAK